MEFANSVVNLIGNIICLGLLVTFLVGLIFGIKFMIQAKRRIVKSIYARKKRMSWNAKKQSSDTRGCWKTDVKQTGGGRYDLPLLFSWKGQ